MGQAPRTSFSLGGHIDLARLSKKAELTFFRPAGLRCSRRVDRISPGSAVERIGWPDKFIEHGSNKDRLRAAHGLAPDDIHRRVLESWRRLNAKKSRKPVS